MEQNSKTADAPNDVMIMGALYTSRNAVLVDMMASMSRIPPKAPHQVKIAISNFIGMYRSQEKGGIGNGSYGAFALGGL